MAETGRRVLISIIGLALLAAAGDDGVAAESDPVGLLDAAVIDAPPLDDDACMQALRCCCCPDWNHYAIFDVLFLQRCNGAGDQPLVIDVDTGDPVMGVQDLQPATASGVRLFYGHLFTDTLGWEIGYTGIYGMFGAATATGDDNLQLPPPLGDIATIDPAFAARSTYWSTLNLFEANIFCYDCCQECGPTRCPLTNCRPNCHCLDWLAGFVWAGLNETANTTMTCCDPPEDTPYEVRTATNYFGAQIGQRGRREWCRWAVEGWWKTALCGTSATAIHDPIVNELVPVREGYSRSSTGVGFIGTLNGTLIYKLTDAWGLRAGYNLYWLTNAALAPSQYNFELEPTGMNAAGVLFMHGANLGVERRW